MSFKKKGYLGSAAKEFIKKHRKEHEVWFSTMDILNEVAHELLENFKADPNNLQQVTCVSLFLRIMASFSSAVKLLELGLSQDAGTVLRSMIESTIFLSACCREKEFVEEFHLANELFRLKIANISLNGEDGSIECTPESRPKLEAVKAKVEKLIAEGKVKKLKVDLIAKKVGLQGVYNTGYRLLSNNHAHSGSASLSRYFQFGKDGAIEAILWQPQMNDIDHLMFTISACFTHSFGVIAEVLPIPTEVTKTLEKKVDDAMVKIKDHTPKNQPAEVELSIK